MHIICLTPLAEGVYNDHSAEHITAPPEGWAYIPPDFQLPSTFPRLGSIEAELKIYGEGENAYTMLTVTAMTEGTLPEVPEDAVKPAASTEQRLADVEANVNELSEALELILSGVTE